MNKNTIRLLLVLVFLSLMAEMGFAQTAKSSAPVAQIDLGLLNGKAKTLVNPTYPAGAKGGGAIRVNVVIDEAGKIITAEASEGDAALREASITAAKQSRFEPYLVRGKAVKVAGFLVFNFVAPAETKPNSGFFASDPKKFLEIYNNSDPKLSKAINSMIEGEKKMDDELRAKFQQAVKDYNALNVVYAEKVNALSEIEKTDTSKNKVGYCQSLLAAEDASNKIEVPLKQLSEMYKAGDVAKVASAKDVESIKYIVEDWQSEVWYPIKLKVSTNIGIFGCRSTEKKMTFDDLMEAVGKNQEAERRNQVIGILNNLGDLAGYFAAGKKYSALTTATPAPEVCKVSLDFKAASDAIEPGLTKLSNIYAEFGEVKFDNPDISKRAAKTLELRTQLFLPKKEEVIKIIGKYNCK